MTSLLASKTKTQLTGEKNFLSQLMHLPVENLHAGITEVKLGTVFGNAQDVITFQKSVG